MMTNKILIVGGGPVGLSCALALAHKGIPSTVIEKDPKFMMIPKASTFHPPTLEIFEELGVIDDLLAQGLKVEKLQYWDRPTKEVIATLDLNLIEEETPYPFRLQLEQSDLQVLLYVRLKDNPLVDILFDHQLVNFTQQEQSVTATLKNGERTFTVETPFLIGADGASSTVRKQLEIEYEGFTYETKFLVLGVVNHDFSKDFPGMYDVSYFYDEQEFIALINNHRMSKLMFKLDDSIQGLEDLPDEVLQQKLRNFTGNDKNFEFAHKGIFNVHQRVAKNVFDHRVILIGDSAHINNPLGGMGMNSGIHDAYFLANDLADIIADPEIDFVQVLKDFEKNRHAAIQEVQRRTIENEKNASKSQGASNAIEKMQQIASNPKYAKNYLLESSMIKDYQFMLKQNAKKQTV